MDLPTYRDWLIGSIALVIDYYTASKLGVYYLLLSYLAATTYCYAATANKSIFELIRLPLFQIAVLLTHYKLFFIVHYAVSADALSFVIGLSLVVYLTLLPSLVEHFNRAYGLAKTVTAANNAAKSDDFGKLIDGVMGMMTKLSEPKTRPSPIRPIRPTAAAVIPTAATATAAAAAASNTPTAVPKADPGELFNNIFKALSSGSQTAGSDSDSSSDSEDDNVAAVIAENEEADSEEERRVLERMQGTEEEAEGEEEGEENDSEKKDK